MTITNGVNHQNVDDILKSIRLASGDQNPGPGFVSASAKGAPQSDGQRPSATSLVTRDQLADEAAEFDLPAIFKPGHQTPAEKPNLFERISDAWKPNTQESERSRTVIRFEPAPAQRMIEPPRAVSPVSPTPGQTHVSEVPPVPVFNQNENVKRELPTFFDTRLNRMGQAPRTEVLTGSLQPEDASSALQSATPLTPALVEAPRGNLGMEDAAAQLLRPILQQWLSENMPRIVEKALRSEAVNDGAGRSATGGGVRQPPR